MGKLELKCRSIVCCLRAYISRHQWPGVCAVERSRDFIANSIMAAINNNKSSRPIDGSERLIEFPSADSINSNRNDLHHRRYTLNTGRLKTTAEVMISAFEYLDSVSSQKLRVDRTIPEFYRSSSPSHAELIAIDAVSATALDLRENDFFVWSTLIHLFHPSSSAPVVYEAAVLC